MDSEEFGRERLLRAVVHTVSAVKKKNDLRENIEMWEQRGWRGAGSKGRGRGGAGSEGGRGGGEARV